MESDCKAAWSCPPPMLQRLQTQEFEGIGDPELEVSQ